MPEPTVIVRMEETNPRRPLTGLPVALVRPRESFVGDKPMQQPLPA